MFLIYRQIKRLLWGLCFSPCFTRMQKHVCVWVWVGFDSSFADCFGMSLVVGGPKVAKQRSEEQGMLWDWCWVMHPAWEGLLLALLHSSSTGAHHEGLMRERFYSYMVIFCCLTQSRTAGQL